MSDSRLGVSPTGALSRAAPPATAVFRGETLIANLALIATVSSIFTVFAVSQITLEAYGFDYVSAGGPAWQKVHPATLLAALALALRCLASGRPAATLARIVSKDPGIVLLLVAVAMTGAFAVVVSKTPVTPLIDTFLLPVLYFWLLRDLDERIIRMIAYGLAALLALNAVIALTEFLVGWRLVNVTPPEGSTADPSRGDGVFDWRASLVLEWRATALLGHPIESGGIIGSFIVCLAVRGSRWLSPLIRWPLVLLEILSMFAFGSRLALVLSVVIAGLVLLREAGLLLARGVRPSPRVLALAAALVPLLVAAVVILIQIGIFDRTLNRFSNDAGSATARVVMFRLFEPLSVYDLLFGPNQDVVHTWQRLEGLEFGIESSWIGLTLTYGLLITTILVTGLLAFGASVLRVAGRGAWLVALFFIVAVSISTALAGKTTVLATVTILVLLFVRRERGPSRQPLRNTL